MDDNYKILNEARRMLLGQRDGLYNIALTIASGALILSINFVGNSTTPYAQILILKISWVFLVMSIMSNILMRYFWGEASFVDLNKEHFKLRYEDKKSVEEFFKGFKPEKKFVIKGEICFWFFWLTFIIGLILLLVFGLVSL